MRLFSRQREPAIRRSDWAAAPARAPEGERIYAIGDIHGCLDLLKMLVAAIEEEQRDLPPARPTIVFLGDYVDRGPDSFGVIDWLCQRPLPEFERVHLRGNHEEWFEEFLADISVGPSWLYCGGVATLASYGIRAALGEDDPMRLRAMQADLAAALPVPHRRFIRALDYYHESGGYLFVHAGIRPGVPLAEQSPDDLIWIRDAFLHTTADHGHVVVHGHTIVNEAQVCPNRIGIDTGAFATNVLTCLVLEADRYRLIQTG